MDPTCVFNFFTFFERIRYKSNCIIFIFSWCATHTKIRSKLVVIVTAGSQKITLWGPQRTPLGIFRVNKLVLFEHNFCIVRLCEFSKRVAIDHFVSMLDKTSLNLFVDFFSARDTEEPMPGTEAAFSWQLTRALQKSVSWKLCTFTASCLSTESHS